MKAAKESEAANEMARLLNVRNGKKAKSTFSSEEMKRRQDNLRKYLTENEIDAALLTSYHNINYYADFLYCHYYGREAGVELREDVETELKPGMVISMEPMIMIRKASRAPAAIGSTTFWW